MEENIKCKICNNLKNNDIYEVREMFLGLRDKFKYFQCSNCGCLQIAEIPKDMSKYYPSNYYSYREPVTPSISNHFKGLFKRLRNKYAVLTKGIFGKIIYYYFPNDTLKMLSQVKLTEESAILDIGCGSGSLLYSLKEIKFDKLLGADPYIEHDIQYDNGLKILKKSIHEIDGKWDLIILHHSFEHIPDPEETLNSVSKLLDNGGVCLIRIPTVSSYAWDFYKENWVQLDAPRHFFLHSLKSISILAEKVRLKVEKVVYESTSTQFWGSEQYIRDIALNDPRSYSVNPTNSIFSSNEIATFKQRAKDYNLKNQGDVCAFFLRKI
jgi:SAM-dependent methyltransferase